MNIQSVYKKPIFVFVRFVFPVFPLFFPGNLRTPSGYHRDDAAKRMTIIHTFCGVSSPVGKISMKSSCSIVSPMLSPDLSILSQIVIPYLILYNIPSNSSYIYSIVIILYFIYIYWFTFSICLLGVALLYTVL